MERTNIIQNFYWKKVFLDLTALVFILVVMLCVVGFLFIYSTSFAGETNLVKQLRWFFISILVFVTLLRINYKWLLENAYTFYALGLTSLLFLLVNAPFVGKTKRWIQWHGLSIQPSEFMKYAMVLVLAKVFSQYYKKKKTDSDIVPAFFLTIIPTFVVFLQPDLGTSLIFFALLLVMAFVMGIPLRHLFLIILVAFSIMYLYGLKPYQKQRIKNFLIPIFQTHIPVEQKRGELYQIMQSLNAYGSGGLLGKGIKQGHQNRNSFLPAKKTDFILAIIGEEWGFVGTVFVLVLFLALYIFLFIIAYSLSDLEAKLIVIGVTSVLAVQTIVNIYVTLGLLPTTGIPLPFISYGGSSLLSSFVGLGMVFSICGGEQDIS